MVVYADRRWRWTATGRFVPGGKRPLDRDPPCVACGRPPTPEGYDACLGWIPGARAACCGHGVKPPYVMWDDRSVQRGEALTASPRWASIVAGQHGPSGGPA